MVRRALLSWGCLLALGLLCVPGCLQDFGQFMEGSARDDDELGGASSGGASSGGADGGGNQMGGKGTGSGGMETGGANSGGCSAGEKECGAECVPLDDPAYGCAPDSCAPCPTSNSTLAICDDGQCAPGGCAVGFIDCEAPDTDCEHQVSDDSETRCGGCDADCTTLGFDVCTSGRCGCSRNPQCRNDARPQDVMCVNERCECAGTRCNSGEGCMADGDSARCSCNGGPACAAGEVCCPSESGPGCKKVDGDDALNCGACGVACPSGYVCASGSCEPEP